MTGRYSRKVQFGKEAAAGTAVAATVMYAGDGVPSEDIDLRRLEYSTGSAPGNSSTFIAKSGGSIALDPTPANFQHLPLLLEMGIETVAAVADAGAGATGKIYTYNIPELVPQAIQTATVQGGDGQQAKRMTYAYAESINISGAAGEPVMMSAQIRGRQWLPQAFTALTPRVVEPIVFGKGVLYADDAFAGWGGTALASTLYGFNLDIQTGLVGKQTASGSIGFDFVHMNRFEANLAITFEYNANAVLEEADWRAQTPRYLSLSFQGSALGVAGTAYTFHTMNIRLYGKWISFDPLSDADGNELIVGNFKCMYDIANTVAGRIVIVNELADIWA